jgi:predicted oxidoreductase
MTKKDYELIASVIKQTNDNGDLDGAATLAHNFADKLQLTNPLFDRQRFLTACGIETLQERQAREFHNLTGRTYETE